MKCLRFREMKKINYKIIYTFKCLTATKTYIFLSQFLVVVLDLVHKNLEKKNVFLKK